jgi:hypothetical protein
MGLTKPNPPKLLVSYTKAQHYLHEFGWTEAQSLTFGEGRNFLWLVRPIFAFTLKEEEVT